MNHLDNSTSGDTSNSGKPYLGVVDQSETRINMEMLQLYTAHSSHSDFFLNIITNQLNTLFPIHYAFGQKCSPFVIVLMYIGPEVLIKNKEYIDSLCTHVK